MRRLFDLIGMTVGGWLGWSLGSMASIFLAFMVSMVGTGLGLYWVRKWTRGMLP